MSDQLKSIIALLAELPEGALGEIEEAVLEATGGLKWVSNPGPQTRALESEADELFYGGEAGGGKSDLLIGASLTRHRRSLILRRTNEEADKLLDRFVEIVGHSHGLNRQNGTWRMDGRLVEIGGCNHESDKQKRKGIPHDLKGFDEITDFTESQYTFIIGWTRTTTPGQRTRIICTGNPPTTPEGLWVTKRWGAWLDPRHPRPAKDGELRWYTTIKDVDTEVDGPGPHIIEGEKLPVRAKSRTFIRAHLSDNYDLNATGEYAASLAALPKDLRAAYRDGRFDVALQDEPMQVIPSDWVFQAQRRWVDRSPPGIPMCGMGVDPAAGGLDDTVIARRHDAWFAPLLVTPGRETPLPSDVAGRVIAARRDDCPVTVDMGGGYGLGVYEHLVNNHISCFAHKGSEGTPARSVEKQYGFFNRRALLYWRFREALDPDQPNGSTIALPPDNELVGDLCVLRFKITGHGIQITTKEKVIDLLGRSPGRGDAVVMCWANGPNFATHGGDWEKHPNAPGRSGRRYGAPPKVILKKPRGR